MSHLHMDHFTFENFGQVLFIYNMVTGGKAPNPIPPEKFKSIKDELLDNSCSWRKYGSSLSKEGTLMMRVSSAGMVTFSFIPNLVSGSASAKNKKTAAEVVKSFDEKMNTLFVEEVKRPKAA